MTGSVHERVLADASAAAGDVGGITARHVLDAGDTDACDVDVRGRRALTSLAHAPGTIGRTDDSEWLAS